MSRLRHAHETSAAVENAWAKGGVVVPSNRSPVQCLITVQANAPIIPAQSSSRQQDDGANISRLPINMRDCNDSASLEDPGQCGERATIKNDRGG